MLPFAVDIHALIDNFVLQVQQGSAFSLETFKSLWLECRFAFIHQAIPQGIQVSDYVQLLYAVALFRLTKPSPLAQPVPAAPAHVTAESQPQNAPQQPAAQEAQPAAAYHAAQRSLPIQESELLHQLGDETIDHDLLAALDELLSSGEDDAAYAPAANGQLGPAAAAPPPTVTLPDPGQGPQLQPAEPLPSGPAPTRPRASPFLPGPMHAGTQHALPGDLPWHEMPAGAQLHALQFQHDSHHQHQLQPQPQCHLQGGLAGVAGGGAGRAPHADGPQQPLSATAGGLQHALQSDGTPSSLAGSLLSSPMFGMQLPSGHMPMGNLPFQAEEDDYDTLPSFHEGMPGSSLVLQAALDLATAAAASGPPGGPAAPLVAPQPLATAHGPQMHHPHMQPLAPAAELPCAQPCAPLQQPEQAGMASMAPRRSDPAGGGLPGAPAAGLGPAGGMVPAAPQQWQQLVPFYAPRAAAAAPVEQLPVAMGRAPGVHVHVPVDGVAPVAMVGAEVLRSGYVIHQPGPAVGGDGRMDAHEPVRLQGTAAGGATDSAGQLAPPAAAHGPALGGDPLELMLQGGLAPIRTAAGAPAATAVAPLAAHADAGAAGSVHSLHGLPGAPIAPGHATVGDGAAPSGSITTPAAADAAAAAAAPPLAARVGALFMLYCLHETQLGQGAVRIYAAVEHVRALAALVSEATQAQLPDVPALVRSLWQRHALVVGAAPAVCFGSTAAPGGERKKQAGPKREKRGPLEELMEVPELRSALLHVRCALPGLTDFASLEQQCRAYDAARADALGLDSELHAVLAGAVAGSSVASGRQQQQQRRLAEEPLLPPAESVLFDAGLGGAFRSAAEARFREVLETLKRKPRRSQQQRDAEQQQAQEGQQQEEQEEVEHNAAVAAGADGDGQTAAAARRGTPPPRRAPQAANAAGAAPAAAAGTAGARVGRRPGLGGLRHAALLRRAGLVPEAEGGGGDGDDEGEEGGLPSRLLLPGVPARLLQVERERRERIARVADDWITRVDAMAALGPYALRSRRRTAGAAGSGDDERAEDEEEERGDTAAAAAEPPRRVAADVFPTLELVCNGREGAYDCRARTVRCACASCRGAAAAAAAAAPAGAQGEGGSQAMAPSAWLRHCGVEGTWANVARVRAGSAPGASDGPTFGTFLRRHKLTLTTADAPKHRAAAAAAGPGVGVVGIKREARLRRDRGREQEEQGLVDDSSDQDLQLPGYRPALEQQQQQQRRELVPQPASVAAAPLPPPLPPQPPLPLPPQPPLSLPPQPPPPLPPQPPLPLPPQPPFPLPPQPPLPLPPQPPPPLPPQPPLPLPPQAPLPLPPQAPLPLPPQPPLPLSPQQLPGGEADDGMDDFGEYDSVLLELQQARQAIQAPLGGTSGTVGSSSGVMAAAAQPDAVPPPRAAAAVVAAPPPPPASAPQPVSVHRTSGPGPSLLVGGSAAPQLCDGGIRAAAGSGQAAAAVAGSGQALRRPIKQPRSPDEQRPAPAKRAKASQPRARGCAAAGGVDATAPVVAASAHAGGGTSAPPAPRNGLAAAGGSSGGGNASGVDPGGGAVGEVGGGEREVDTEDDGVIAEFEELLAAQRALKLSLA